VKLHVVRNVRFYSCCAEPYPDITYTVQVSLINATLIGCLPGTSGHVILSSEISKAGYSMVYPNASWVNVICWTTGPIAAAKDFQTSIPGDQCHIDWVLPGAGGQVNLIHFFYHLHSSDATETTLLRLQHDNALFHHNPSETTCRVLGRTYRPNPIYLLISYVPTCFIITLISLLGFYIPSNSGEKVSMGITTLLSMTVFLMLVAENMPPTSDVLPLVGKVNPRVLT